MTTQPPPFPTDLWKSIKEPGDYQQRQSNNYRFLFVFFSKKKNFFSKKRKSKLHQCVCQTYLEQCQGKEKGRTAEHV